MTPTPRARTRALRSLAALAAALLLAGLATPGCAPRRAPAPPTPPPARPKPGYDGPLSDSLALLDTRALGGRRIVLDPGHGGFFRGALGRGGTTEAEVNLGVTLALRERLRSAGADVRITRESDRDFLAPGDSALRTDLNERTRIANAWDPELFVSIHHNADPLGRDDQNEIQTYYKLGDDGPSLEAAQDIHRALVRNLGIERHRVVPGNFAVVRNSRAPALLTEASYITNPDVEARLRIPEKQQLEADALYVGIARYFARPLPVVERFEAVAHDSAAPDTHFFAIPAPRLRAWVRGAWDQAELLLDGVAVPGQRLGDQVEWRPGVLAAGRHEAVLRVRLSGTGSARERRLAFTLDRKPARLETTALGVDARRASGPVALRIAITDAFGLPSPDSLALRVRVRNAPHLTPADTVVTARDGVAWAYFHARTPRTARARRTLAEARVMPADRAARARFADTVVVRVGPLPAPGTWHGFVRAMPGDTALAGAPGTREPGPALGWLNRDGFATLALDSAGAPVLPELPGYRPWPADSAGPPRYVAIAAGGLHGRRIVVDPEGGGEDAAGTGRLGTRGSHLNLDLARMLAGYLRAAGADVRLTRDGDFAVSEVERVQLSERFRAERYVRIASRTAGLGHYFSSAPGKRFAESAARTLQQLGLGAPPVGDNASYPIQQATAVGLYAAPGALDSSAYEAAMLAPGGARARAYALYLALAREWAPAGAEWPLDSVEVRDPAGLPVAGAPVVLGGALVLETDALGRARFARTEPGPVELALDSPRRQARTIAPEGTRGVVLAAPAAP